MTHYPNFFLNIKAEYLLCGSCIRPKKQFEGQIIGILEEKTPLIDQKCTYEKVPNLGWALLTPLIWTKSKRTPVSFRDNVFKWPIWPKKSIFSET